ncbi:hypothetical protein D3C86_2251050 [compost metagenome]
MTHGPHGAGDDGVEELGLIALGINLFARGVGDDDARQGGKGPDRGGDNVRYDRSAQRRHVEPRGGGLDL